MSNVKTLNNLLNFSQNLLIIKERSSFKKIFHKVKHTKKREFVYMAKPVPSQMAALILARLSGRNFYWIQGFSNPPKPGFFARILINQADVVLVKSKRVAANLRGLGIEKPNMRVFN